MVITSTKRTLGTDLSERKSRCTMEISWKRLIKKRLPILNWLPIYTWTTFSQDLLAGVTVGLMLVPQAIAYASIAGLSPEYGLYTGFMGCYVYVLLGTSKDITIGPTAILSLFSQAHVLAMGPDAAVLLAFFTGVIVFTMGVLQLGFIVDFFSYPLTSGFTSAGALTVAATQFNSLLGIPGRANEFLSALIGVFQKLSQVQLWDATLGFTTLVALILLRELRKLGSLRYNPKWTRRRNYLGRVCFYIYLGRNALAVAVGMSMGYAFEKHNLRPFTMTGTINEGLPTFSLPPFSTVYENQTYTFIEMMNQLGSTLIFAPAVAILENISIAKVFAGGRTLDATQEMLAVGMSNIMGSFVRSYAVTGSFSRTAVNNASGVKTPMGGIVTGTMVLLALGFLSPAAHYIPKASLAAVVICAMIFLFEYSAIVTLWRTKKWDLIPFMLTLFACLFLGLEYGILVGLGGNLLFVLRFSSRPQVAVEKEVVLDTEVFLVTPYNSIQYPAAEYFREKIMEECREAPLVVVVGTYVKSIDATVAKNFKILAEDLMRRKQAVVFWKFKPSIMKICGGLDKNLVQYFRSEDVEEIVKEIVDGSDLKLVKSEEEL